MHNGPGVQRPKYFCFFPLPEKQEAALVHLPHEIPIRFLVIRGKDAAGEMEKGIILKISKRKVVIACKNVTVEKFTNIKCHFFSKQLEKIPGEVRWYNYICVSLMAMDYYIFVLSGQ